MMAYRETAAQQYHFPTARAKSSRALWLTVAARTEPLDKPVRAMLLCGSSMMLEHSASTDQYRISAPSCANRFCPRCSRIVARERIRKVKSIADARPERGLKLITIAPQHTTEPLDIQMQHLRSSFRRLRQQRCWRDAALHGACVMEIKVGRDDLWHPHLHIIADMHYVPHCVLLDACRTAVGRECSVDIRRIQNPAKCVDYVSKYLAKGCNDEATLSRCPELADELYVAMHRAKTCWTWGKTAPRPPKEPRKRLPADDWRAILPYGQIMLGLRCGSAEIRYMLDAAGAPVRALLSYIHRRE